MHIFMQYVFKSEINYSISNPKQLEKDSHEEMISCFKLLMSKKYHYKIRFIPEKSSLY